MRITILVNLLLLISFWSYSQDDADRYLVKSGYIEYELTGSTKGFKKIWWNDYGDKERTETKSSSEVKLFGMVQKEEEHSIHITSGDKFWHVNLLEGTGIKGTEEYYEPVDFTENMTDEKKKQIEEDILNAFGGERLPADKFLGYTCDIIQVMGSKLWIYKGVVLKSTANLMGVEVNETAVRFDENIKNPDSTFEPPANINFEEGSYD
jgi:hypothetical protein